MCLISLFVILLFYSSLIIPANNIRKRSPTCDEFNNEKRRKLNDDDITKSPKADNEMLRPIGKQVLDILNTPLVVKTIVSPSVTNYSSILKVNSWHIYKYIQVCLHYNIYSDK